MESVPARAAGDQGVEQIRIADAVDVERQVVVAGAAEHLAIDATAADFGEIHLRGDAGPALAAVEEEADGGVERRRASVRSVDAEGDADVVHARAAETPQ